MELVAQKTETCNEHLLGSYPASYHQGHKEGVRESIKVEGLTTLLCGKPVGDMA
jgi:hypothetical protein